MLGRHQPWCCSMAPKRKSVAPAPQLPRAAKKRALQAEEATLLEKEAAAEVKPGPQKSGKARSFEASVHKALADNFVRKGVEAASLDLLTRDGKTIREIVAEAKMKHEKNRRPHGQALLLRAAQ